MAYQTLQEYNATTPDQLLAYVGDTWSGFIPLLLISFYIIIALAVYYSQTRKTGRGELSVSVAVAGFITFILSLVLSLVGGLVNSVIMSITFIVMILGVVWLFLSKDSIY
jgi:lipopolysaccharide export LptBFGC system permease protein LptF